MRFKLLIFFVLPTILTSQEIDLSKVERIGSILCNCLESNEELEAASRIDDCGYVLSEGLSVIKSDSLKYLYSSKADTYLQKNCLSYLKILSKGNPNSDIRVESKLKYDNLKKENIDYRVLEKGNYMYRDFINDTIYVRLNNNQLIENSKGYNTTTTFSIEQDESIGQMFFLKSDEVFYKDYYIENEPIDFILVKEKEGFRLFTRFSNGIVLSKRLSKVKA